MPPTSQKNRPIRITGDTGDVDFTIRPEDLTWSEPSRLAVVQTLGDAWVDAFGPGIATITIAGHTGWRGGQGGDWLAQFNQLRYVAFTRWHEMVSESKDPESVVMWFVDSLDERVARVVPQNFVLKRSKSRPLFMQYNIQFLVVKQADVSGGGDPPPMSPMAQFAAAMGSLQSAIQSVSAAVQTAQSIANGNLGAVAGVLGSALGSDVGSAVGSAMWAVNAGMAASQSVMAGGPAAAAGGIASAALSGSLGASVQSAVSGALGAAGIP